MHALCDCSFAKEVLRIGCMDNQVIDYGWTIGIDWLEEAMRFLDGTAFECLLIVLWNVWNSKNNFLFRGTVELSKVVWDRAIMYGWDFRIHNLNNAPMIPTTSHL